MLNLYETWDGNRNGLYKKLSEIEYKLPEKYKMVSKKTGKPLELKLNRIQQFLNLKIIPKAVSADKGFGYNEEHIFRYLAAIVLYNSGQSLKQISEILNSYTTDEIKNLFLSNEKLLLKEAKPKIISDKFTQKNIENELKILGREEGRVLRSQWIKFAITKWCIFEIKKKELSKLTDNEVETLTQAFKLSLMQTKSLKNLDKSIF